MISLKRGACKDRRALSPVIATTMLILLVLVLAAIIFLWMKGFVSEQIMKFDKPTEQICQEVSFDAQLTSPTELEISNTGNIPISSFEIKRVLPSGNSEIKNFAFSVDPGQAIRGEFSQVQEEVAAKLIVYPVVVGNVKGKSLNKAYTCTGQSKNIITN